MSLVRLERNHFCEKESKKQHLIECVCVLGSPDRDESDKVIEDEFSDMPVIQQWCLRFYRKIRYYEKVSKQFLARIYPFKKV